MKIILTIAKQQGANRLLSVKQAHIDGCIYASPANLIFAEKMAALGGQVRIPTTMNAISVDYKNWRDQAIPVDFGNASQRLADAYVAMGCQPTFTCSPYLLDTRPNSGDAIAWAESNAVVFANSILGARTAKHPDFLDLCIALTGRAPESGVYLDENRRAQIVLNIQDVNDTNDAFWPLIGYVIGNFAPDRIPLVTGLETSSPNMDDLKALCASFGTTSASPLLHIAGITPESWKQIETGAETINVTIKDLDNAWNSLNDGPLVVDLVAIGSPHASKQECEKFLQKIKIASQSKQRNLRVNVIVTASAQVIKELEMDGTLSMLLESAVKVYPDFCWCSIVEPVFPSAVKAVITNSGKYAHYGPGLSGRPVRLASMDDCVEAAMSGYVPLRRKGWRNDTP